MQPILSKVTVNNFVKRQVKGSGKTYSKNLNFEQIANHAESQLSKGQYKNGYRDGVILCKVSKDLVNQFICPLVRINETTILKAELVKRRPKEEPYIQIKSLNGTPVETGAVDLILYHHNILAETNEQTSGSEWELISFHALPKGVKTLPMGAITMMRNQMQLEGGTKGFYSSDEWAKSIHFWQKYAAINS